MAVTQPADDTAEPGGHERFVSTSATGPLVVTTDHGPGSLVYGADLVGLAAALARTMSKPSLLAVANSDGGSESSTGQPVRFPEPVGVRIGEPAPSPIDDVQLLLAPGVDEWSGLRVTGERTLALVDDGRFAAAVILAAAATLPPGPVWEHPEDLLREVKRLGLRFAQAA